MRPDNGVQYTDAQSELLISLFTKQELVDELKKREGMTEKPNCGNCPNTSCYNNLIRQDKILTLEQSSDTRLSYVAVRDHTKTHGCLSNPNAKEWLMADVIKELEATIKCNSRWDKLEPYYSGVNATCKIAIALIKNGVDGK